MRGVKNKKNAHMTCSYVTLLFLFPPFAKLRLPLISAVKLCSYVCPSRVHHTLAQSVGSMPLRTQHNRYAAADGALRQSLRH